MSVWRPINTAPRDRPFLMATTLGTIMLELWCFDPLGRLVGASTGTRFDDMRAAISAFDRTIGFVWTDVPNIEGVRHPMVSTSRH